MDYGTISNRQHILGPTLVLLANTRADIISTTVVGDD